MLIHDDIYSWEGWGGKLKLGSGSCRLRIYDLTKGNEKKGLAHIRPVIVIVSDIPESKMSVKSCVSHVATCVVRDFRIDWHRMLWVEYYPASTYGIADEHLIPERFDMVEFEWHEDSALHPKWRPPAPQMAENLKTLISE